MAQRVAVLLDELDRRVGSTMIPETVFVIKHGGRFFVRTEKGARLTGVRNRGGLRGDRGLRSGKVERMRALVIDDAAKAKAKALREHAEAHPWLSDVDKTPPGDRPEHVVMLNSYRTVFSITHHAGYVMRHLSVSIPGAPEGKYPHPAAVFMIADLLGFTGWNEAEPFAPASDWMCRAEQTFGCVSVIQTINSSRPKH